MFRFCIANDVKQLVGNFDMYFIIHWFVFIAYNIQMIFKLGIIRHPALQLIWYNWWVPVSEFSPQSNLGQDQNWLMSGKN